MRQLQVFVAASRARSFSEAADRLGISQPSLSGTISKIETQLGLRLFDRTTRSLILTADGRDLAAVADDLVRDFEAALSGISARAAGKRGRVSVAVLPSVAATVLPEALGAFAKEYPEIDVSVHDVLQERAVAILRNGVVDFAVTTQAAAYPELHFEELGADPFYLVCKRNHPLARLKTVTWKDTVDYPFIALSATTSVRRFADTAMGQTELVIRPRYEVEQILSAVTLVSAGLGITALPSLTLAMFSHRALAMRPLVAPAIQRRLGVLTLRERTLSAPARFLLERVSKTLAATAKKTS
ncbi:MAG: LysR family transcriptional regulator [Pseudolabrys sp.]|nr:LysR family transcriptional regulator [Pseudolabrys sp.]